MQLNSKELSHVSDFQTGYWLLRTQAYELSRLGGSKILLPKIYAWKINKMADFYMTLARKINKIPEFYMIFAPKIFLQIF